MMRLFLSSHQYLVRYVVPFNRNLIVKFQAHINIEWCNRAKSIKDPVVQRLSYHLENEQSITFRESESLPRVLKRTDPNSTMFVQWMKANDNGIPNHDLDLKIGAPIMLMRNINPRDNCTTSKSTTAGRWIQRAKQSQDTRECGFGRIRSGESVLAVELRMRSSCSKKGIKILMRLKVSTACLLEPKVGKNVDKQTSA
ncbi:hypothetical protein RJ640_026532 [Escallonia rubra]|uniref:DNA helicase Pif1-like 2B domain-containing protein n=1 Tax=Escallonia rubra TaxID=112253 RepID=A0AA88UFK7_9ASTE|nr:hypothetical protein RJ640_026532 [Escallonia rubra]